MWRSCLDRNRLFLKQVACAQDLAAGPHLSIKPGEWQLFRAMAAALTDKEPQIAAPGRGGDPAMGAYESVRCLNDHS